MALSIWEWEFGCLGYWLNCNLGEEDLGKEGFEWIIRIGYEEIGNKVGT